MNSRAYHPKHRAPHLPVLKDEESQLYDGLAGYISATVGSNLKKEKKNTVIL